MVVNTNILALNSHRALKGVGNRLKKASSRLSSGMRVNSAADDATGLAISEKMRAQIRGMQMSFRNTQDGMSLLQTAEGGMQEITNMLQRIRELVDFAANDTNTHNLEGTGDRQKIQDEIDQLIAEIDLVSQRACISFRQFLRNHIGTIPSFDEVIETRMSTTIVMTDRQLPTDIGSQGPLWFQAGANSNQGMFAFIGAMDAATLGLAEPSSRRPAISVLNDSGSRISPILSVLDTAISYVSTERSRLGAMHNRLECTSRSLSVSTENLSASESRIRDADMAREMMDVTAANVLQQAAIAMLAQANQAPNAVLQLL